MNVVDCTIGVRIAPVSLSGLMPWWTSLLRRVFFVVQQSSRRAGARQKERDRDAEHAFVDVVRVTEPPNARGQACSTFQAACVYNNNSSTTQNRELYDLRLHTLRVQGKRRTVSLTFRAPSPCLPAMFHIRPTWFSRSATYVASWGKKRIRYGN